MAKKKVVKTKKNKGFKFEPWMAISGVYAISAVVLLVLLLMAKLLPVPYLIAGIFGLIAIGLLVFALTRYKKKKVLFTIGTILAVLGLVVNCFGSFYLHRTVDTLRAMSGVDVERHSVTFYTLADNEAENLADLQNGTFGILTALDRENTDDALANVEKEDGFALATAEYDSLTAIADALLNHEVDGIAMNEAYLGIYEETEGYQEFPNQIKVISTEIVEREVEQVSTADKEVFTVLISGSDTRGQYLDVSGRSDVNILAVVNRETHQILLVSTPRDYYVELAIPGVTGAMDKLTHAGIYGVDCSKNTIGNLYGITVDYYFRINFTGFVDIINALGGIEVNSEIAFTSRIGGYYFNQGINYLNGDQALAYARERYAFAEGDRMRGKHQMDVIQAVMNKAMSPSILNSYSSILQSVEGCVDMSIPYDLLAGIVNDQLSNNVAWSIESMSADGTGTYSSTYSMGAQQLYVMIPDQATVDAAKTRISQVMAVSSEEQ